MKDKRITDMERDARKALGLGRGSEQATAVLAVYLSKRVDGFDLDEFLGLLRTVQDKNPNRKAVSRWKESFPGRVIDRVKRIKEQVPDQGPPEPV